MPVSCSVVGTTLSFDRGLLTLRAVLSHHTRPRSSNGLTIPSMPSTPVTLVVSERGGVRTH